MAEPCNFRVECNQPPFSIIDHSPSPINIDNNQFKKCLPTLAVVVYHKGHSCGNHNGIITASPIQIQSYGYTDTASPIQIQSYGYKYKHIYIYIQYILVATMINHHRFTFLDH